MTQIAQHAVHRLYQIRKALATKPYASRGNKLVRCEQCLLAVEICTCQYRQMVNSHCAFLLIMYDYEVLKPSNSGRLIADLIPQTHAYLWSRTDTDPQLLALINDPHYQPIVVFPAEYTLETQTVYSDLSDDFAEQGKTPLFILLDGCWRQAVKMFRKSHYLHQLPVLSFSPETLAKYALRKGSRDFQLGTAEVASLVLNAYGETANAASLNAWFELFVESTKQSRRSARPDQEVRSLVELRQQFAQSIHPGVARV